MIRNFYSRISYSSLFAIKACYCYLLSVYLSVNSANIYVYTLLFSLCIDLLKIDYKFNNYVQRVIFIRSTDTNKL